MKKFLHTSIFFMMWLAAAASANGQKLSDAELQTFLSKATEKAVEYSAVFKNLTAEETKFFDTFDKTGSLRTRKKVLSDLIIYESPTDKGNLGEFRNVREVDNKKIKDSDNRTVEVFSKLADAKSFADELEKLNREGSRYDKNISFYGVVLNQAFPLMPDFTASFKFEEIGRDTIEDSGALVVEFRQIAANPNLNVKITAPKFLEISNTFYRGTVWLDLKNYRVLKFVSELALDSARFTEPFILIREKYLYQPGKFQIYLPQKIVIESFSQETTKAAKLLLKNSKIKPDPELQTRLTMEYKTFSKFDVIVKSEN